VSYNHTPGPGKSTHNAAPRLWAWSGIPGIRRNPAYEHAGSAGRYTVRHLAEVGWRIVIYDVADFRAESPSSSASAPST
jgi:hypothetical protein